jgi:hypothetical protein
MLIKLGKRSERVMSIQKILRFLGYRAQMGTVAVPQFLPIKVDGYFGPETEAAVIDFQEDENLHSDGIVGPNTMAALEASFSRRMLELNSPGVDVTMGMPDRLTIERLPADVFGESYDQVSLRSDISPAYRAVYEAVHRNGGILAITGGLRSLGSTASAFRSALSFHYLGRAFDLFIYGGMTDPRTDPYVIVCGDQQRSFRVYARCVDVGGSLAREMTLRRVVTYQDRRGNGEVGGRFLDLTELLAKHGFQPVKALRRFEEGGRIGYAKWWHFQNEAGLIPGVSTFGGELLKLYSFETLENTAPWKYRHRIFDETWASFAKYMETAYNDNIEKHFDRNS